MIASCDCLSTKATAEEILDHANDAELIERLRDDFDVCRCGDYRHQHVNGIGRCNLADLCFPQRCGRFHLYQTAAQAVAAEADFQARFKKVLERIAEKKNVQLPG